MFHELAINCRNFSFSKKGRSNCAGRRISIRKGGEAMDTLAGSVVTCAYDANGNITEYVGDGGQILSHCDYSAFGRELINAGSDDFTHRFSTKPYCRKTGFIEYQLRKYKPWCGRWMNRDAIEEDGGLNLYGYVGNMMISEIDILGCMSAEECSDLLSNIINMAEKLKKAMNKYNPAEDAKGGFPFFWGLTKSGGHYQKINDLQHGIKKKLKDFGQGCSNGNNELCDKFRYPKDIDNLANRPIPSPTVTPNINVANGVAIVGGAYVTYRIIRIIPSVIAPPTLIPNLLMP